MMQEIVERAIGEDMLDLNMLVGSGIFYISSQT